MKRVEVVAAQILAGAGRVIAGAEELRPFLQDVRHLVVNDADEWVDLNSLRNQLVYEYPIDGREQVDRVNECWAALPRLLTIHERLRAVLIEQGVEP